MGKKGEGFFLSRIRANVRVQPPTTTSQHGCSHEPQTTSIGIKGRRIMVVVDSCSEAKNALLWTLSHCAQPQDSILILHFLKAKTSQSGDLANKKEGEDESCDKPTTSRADKKVSALKTMCELKRPEVKTEVVVVKGDEKGPTIVKEAREREASLLVLGQKKQHATWRLLMVWASQSRPVTKHDFVEYCINNSPCMAIAVRKRGKKLGGYTLTTKRHKDFWLLA
ncbi:UspA [Arabidopsis suecica]|uniref:UspA n=1 Tax=Arabidopsis suecica TaxID=45249 RepID=A0A8T2BT16_ARASU|nr:UspA [Arabidopsis suecica]